MNRVEYRNEFYSPFSGAVMIKAEEEGGKWIVYLQASNEGLDQEEEVIMSKALREAKDYYLQHGVLSWDHKHKALHDPKYIIGEPMEVAFSKSNETLVKGWLYQKNEIAKNLWGNIESGAHKLGASVGGGILQKSEGKIEKVVWDETALTHKPVNDATLGHVQLIPFEQFAKALMAGGGVNASDFSGGRAMAPEDMEESLIDGTFGQTDVPHSIDYETARRYFDWIIPMIVKGKITSMNDVVSYTLDQGYEDRIAADLIQYVQNKVPKLSI